ncbi:hypothetical protein F2Q68_00033589 [Brassica cretica]|uniref:Uncharacterized protein n=1 Tax=Brassica cretica TaxID=69181 RepID=A0A8S9H790_BRACR|nr:hypothetical protein F2Q68_00033589 [Brassica cretica]
MSTPISPLPSLHITSLPKSQKTDLSVVVEHRPAFRSASRMKELAIVGGEFWPVTYEGSEVDLMMFSGESGTKNVNCVTKSSYEVADVAAGEDR